MMAELGGQSIKEVLPLSVNYRRTPGDGYLFFFVYLPSVFYHTCTYVSIDIYNLFYEPIIKHCRHCSSHNNNIFSIFPINQSVGNIKRQINLLNAL